MLYRFGHSFGAAGTHVLALEDMNVFCVATEDASRLIFLKNDLFVVYIDFKGIFLIDAESPTELDGNYYAPKLVHFPDNAC